MTWALRDLLVRFSAGRFQQLCQARVPPLCRELCRIQTFAVHQRRVGAQRQQPLHSGGVAVQGGQHQGGFSFGVAGIHWRALLHEGFDLLGLARAGGLPDGVGRGRAQIF